MSFSEDKPLFGICQSIVKSDNSVPCLCRNFTVKDNHVLLKEYEFHEMLLCKMHMCFSEKIIRGLGYVKDLTKLKTVFTSL